MSAYIPTNVISITDGQVFLETLAPECPLHDVSNGTSCVVERLARSTAGRSLCLRSAAALANKVSPELTKILSEHIANFSDHQDVQAGIVSTGPHSVEEWVRGGGVGESPSFCPVFSRALLSFSPAYCLVSHAHVTDVIPPFGWLKVMSH